MHNFYFVIGFQRNKNKNTEIAIYQNVADSNFTITPQLDIKAPHQTDGDIIVWSSSKMW